MLSSYRQVFRIPGLLPPLLASFAGSLPIGMLSLSVLLLVRLHGQSFGAAGMIAGALNLGGSSLTLAGTATARLPAAGSLTARSLTATSPASAWCSWPRRAEPLPRPPGARLVKTPCGARSRHDVRLIPVKIRVYVCSVWRADACPD